MSGPETGRRGACVLGFLVHVLKRVNIYKMWKVLSNFHLGEFNVGMGTTVTVHIFLWKTEPTYRKGFSLGIFLKPLTQGHMSLLIHDFLSFLNYTANTINFEFTDT
jgi:hypothetical protein